ncbi:hypothetical protein ACTXMZ_10260 [Brachybacterium alimentarium]|uniref:hypothetical protein n=1 Tax=Brachybacterium alimentarium TaxID=47845 RepID=UPI003FD26DD1
MTYRALDFSVEIPHEDPVAHRVTDMGQQFIAVAVDLTDDMIAGFYRLALTHDEARHLHEGLGAALGKEDH